MSPFVIVMAEAMITYALKYGLLFYAQAIVFFKLMWFAPSPSLRHKGRKVSCHNVCLYIYIERDFISFLFIVYYTEHKTQRQTKQRTIK